MIRLSEELINTVRSFVETISKIESDWNTVFAEIGDCDSEVTDLLHEIELTDFNPVEGNQISEEIKRVRIKRREKKDYQEIIRPLKDYIDRNKNMQTDLFRVLRSMERTQEYQSNRNYNPRVRTDLKLSSPENNCETNSEYLKNLEVELNIDLTDSDRFKKKDQLP